MNAANPGFDAPALEAHLAGQPVPDQPLPAGMPTRGEERVLGRLPAPVSTEPTRLAVLSDPHLSTRHEGGWKCFHRTEERLRTAVADLAETHPDGVVFAGDLTKDGHPDDHAVAAELFGSLSFPVVGVPGNHDTKEGVELPWLDRGPTAIDDLTVAGFASAGYSPEEGGRLASPPTLTHLDGVDIAVSHHNLDGLGVPPWRGSYPMWTATEVERELADAGVPLHVSGHLHIPAVVPATVPGGVSQIVAPALSSFPCAYLLLDIDATGTTITLRGVADEAALAEAWDAAHAYNDRSRLAVQVAARQLAAAPVVPASEAATADD
ncbi:metallophosphoesterase family protein [Natronomonas sp. EA1]|uniref:metallophosphoesterase family protein n=1 Tax=Natronomonas sp. EA1 TaxID=3421655 RepID=UPI003EBB0B49